MTASIVILEAHTMGVNNQPLWEKSSQKKIAFVVLAQGVSLPLFPFGVKRIMLMSGSGLGYDLFL